MGGPGSVSLSDFNYPDENLEVIGELSLAWLLADNEWCQSVYSICQESQKSHLITEPDKRCIARHSIALRYPHVHASVMHVTF